MAELVRCRHQEVTVRTKQVKVINSKAVEALREKGSLEVTTHLDAMHEKIHSVFYSEFLQFKTEAGPMAVHVSHVELGYLNRGAHDCAWSLYGHCYTTERYLGGESMNDTSTYVRIVFYGEADSCWVEHIATLPGPYFLRMCPTLVNGEEDYLD